ncbi:hypothetical protein CERZMDRAFT_91549 [Cercospora zeae-maydis SCOH1-5]|uniref:Uncharacterized protein n=1 Tax=Cercospora zeae-maydis SCOH1-5 TaxID=717836 RepID=A0A6A6F1Z9_9PEZI|nr:hypothetical protein CERZMDRAFT_91549 [Cercospora zeae-maydis SCOH1-5]
MRLEKAEDGSNPTRSMRAHFLQESSSRLFDCQSASRHDLNNNQLHASWLKVCIKGATSRCNSSYSWVNWPIERQKAATGLLAPPRNVGNGVDRIEMSNLIAGRSSNGKEIRKTEKERDGRVSVEKRRQDLQCKHLHTAVFGGLWHRIACA